MVSSACKSGLGQRVKIRCPLGRSEFGFNVRPRRMARCSIFPLLADIAGPLNVDALQRSLDAIVRRHEVLRSGFRAINGVPRPFFQRRREGRH